MKGKKSLLNLVVGSAPHLKCSLHGMLADLNISVLAGATPSTTAEGSKGRGTGEKEDREEMS